MIPARFDESDGVVDDSGGVVDDSGEIVDESVRFIIFRRDLPATVIERESYDESGVFGLDERESEVINEMNFCFYVDN